MQVRDWIHVEDHCDAIWHVLGSAWPTGEVFNVSGAQRGAEPRRDGRDPALAGAARTLIRHVNDRPGHDRRYALDASKLRATGWAPRWTFDDGLAATSRGTATTRLVAGRQERRVSRLLRAHVRRSTKTATP